MSLIYSVSLGQRLPSRSFLAHRLLLNVSLLNPSDSRIWRTTSALILNFFALASSSVAASGQANLHGPGPSVDEGFLPAESVARASMRPQKPESLRSTFARLSRKLNMKSRPGSV